MLNLTTRVAWHLVELRDRLHRERGQGMVEYGLIIALIAIALVVVLGFVTGGLKTVFNSISSSLNSA
jgi:pilus assembly protein Flp/PilA